MLHDVIGLSHGIRITIVLVFRYSLPYRRRKLIITYRISVLGMASTTRHAYRSNVSANSSVANKNKLEWANSVVGHKVNILPRKEDLHDSAHVHPKHLNYQNTELLLSLPLQDISIAVKCWGPEHADIKVFIFRLMMSRSLLGLFLSVSLL